MGKLIYKLKASSLIETLVATVIILAVFIAASLVLNNVFRNLSNNDTYAIENELEFLQYQYSNNRISLPYSTSYKEYEINVYEDVDSLRFVYYEAITVDGEKTIVKKILSEK